MNIIQKVKSILIPEIGLDVVPESVIESEITTDFSRTISHLAVRTGKRSVLVTGTSDGKIHSAAAGTSMEIYLVESGDAPAAYDAGSTFEQENAIYVTDFLIETQDATVQFRNMARDWGDPVSLPVGFHSKDFIHYGVRIQDRLAAGCIYEIVMYR
ncbi:hypothetical protein ES708_33701 [subsurface metagenome]